VRYIVRNQLTEKMASSSQVNVPRQVVQAEWEAMMERVKEVAHVLEHSTEVDPQVAGYIILDATRGDVPKAEEVIFWNLLFRPSSRVDDGRTVEISGEWLWSWRRYGAYELLDDQRTRWFKENRPELKMFRYQLQEQVVVEW
jgi:hypothetical protein